MAEPVGLVFPTSKGGAWTRDDWRNWTRRVWRPAAKDAGLEGSRARDLRGSFASLLIWQGMNVLEVAEQLGDTKETCLGTYAGLFADYDERNRVSAEEKIWAARAKVRPQSVLKMAGPAKNPEPTRGLEPRTPSLRVKCSTS
jgi:integrase